MDLLKTKNLDGVEVTYSPELAQDIKAVYGLDVKELLESIHGTTLRVKSENTDNYVKRFAITTNDERDSGWEAFFTLKDGKSSMSEWKKIEKND